MNCSYLKVEVAALLKTQSDFQHKRQKADLRDFFRYPPHQRSLRQKQSSSPWGQQFPAPHMFTNLKPRSL